MHARTRTRTHACAHTHTHTLPSLSLSLTHAHTHTHTLYTVDQWFLTEIVLGPTIFHEHCFMTQYFVTLTETGQVFFIIENITVCFASAFAFYADIQHVYQLVERSINSGSPSVSILGLALKGGINTFLQHSSATHPEPLRDPLLGPDPPVEKHCTR